jgi:hypothetical protein
LEKVLNSQNKALNDEVFQKDWQWLTNRNLEHMKLFLDTLIKKELNIGKISAISYFLLAFTRV